MSKIGKISFLQGLLKKHPLGFIIFCIYLITIPLFTQFNVINLFHRISMSHILLILSLLFSIPFIHFKQLFKNILIIIIVTYLIIILFSSLNIIIDEEITFLFWSLRFLQIIIIAILLVTWADKKIFRQKIIYFFLLGALIASIIGILQVLNIEFIWEITDKYYLESFERARDSSTYMNRIASTSFFPINGNYFGSYMAISMIVLFNYRSYFRFWNFISIFFVCLLGLLTSLSWTSIFGLVFSIITANVFYIISNRKLKKHFLIFITTIILAFPLFLFFNYDKFINKFSRYFLTSNAIFLARGLDNRILTWDAWLSNVNNFNNLFLGLGYSKFQILDNFYMEILSAGGIISLLAFIAMLVMLLLFKANNIQKFAAVIFFIICNLTGSYGSYPALLCGLMLVTVNSQGDFR